MSNPSTSNASNPHSSFSGDEFSNNLLSDLAPLLTLFGEQVTKQFLSLSMGWADNILIALGPLGIMTIVVSAIRVGGNKRLKAVIGRARESKAVAEAELLSSTSNEVCEMWNGQDVVRTFGVPATREIVITQYGMNLWAHSFEGAYNNHYLKECRGQELSPDQLKRLVKGAPNLTLNVLRSPITKFQLWAWALLSTLVQLGAIVFPAVVTYHWGWEATPYGYVCFVAGSFLIFGGLALCSHAIEGSTTEHDFVTNLRKPASMEVVYLQRTAVVSEQRYSSYLLLSSNVDFKIRTSRLNNKDYSKISALATVATLTGFVCQFIGLRAMHWSATVVSLGFTILMASVRAWVRRGLAFNAGGIKLPPPPYDLSWISLLMTHRDYLGKNQDLRHVGFPDYLLNDNYNREPLPTPPSFIAHFEIVTGFYYFKAFPHDYIRAYYFPASVTKSFSDLPECDRPLPEIHLVSSILNLPRIGLRGNIHEEAASQLSTALITVLKLLCNDSSVIWKGGASPGKPIVIELHVTRLKRRDQSLKPPSSWGELFWTNKYTLTLTPYPGEYPGCIAWQLGNGEKLNGQQELCAILHLWHCSLHSRDMGQPGMDHIRIIGSSHFTTLPVLLRRLAIWLDDELVVCPCPNGTSGSGFLMKSLPVFGCRYSSMYPNSTNEDECLPQPSSDLPQNTLAPVFLDGDKPATATDVAVYMQNPLYIEFALEIMSIFMDTFARLIADLGGVVTTRKRIKIQANPDDLREHRTVEHLIDSLLKTAPLLFPSRKNAEIILIPALVRHNVLKDA